MRLLVKSLILLAGRETLDKFGPGFIGFAGKKDVT